MRATAYQNVQIASTAWWTEKYHKPFFSLSEHICKVTEDTLSTARVAKCSNKSKHATVWFDDSALLVL
uniref:Uncharacterized protein n=1 Tax=Anguilla anguilla TaxID=7936 RepID=A0A0E9U1H1_ANGAN